MTDWNQLTSAPSPFSFSSPFQQFPAPGKAANTNHSRVRSGRMTDRNRLTRAPCPFPSSSPHHHFPARGQAANTDPPRVESGRMTNQDRLTGAPSPSHFPSSLQQFPARGNAANTDPPRVESGRMTNQDRLTGAPSPSHFPSSLQQFPARGNAANTDPPRVESGRMTNQDRLTGPFPSPLQNVPALGKAANINVRRVESAKITDQDRLTSAPTPLQPFPAVNTNLSRVGSARMIDQDQLTGSPLQAFRALHTLLQAVNTSTNTNLPWVESAGTTDQDRLTSVPSLSPSPLQHFNALKQTPNPNLPRVEPGRMTDQDELTGAPSPSPSSVPSTSPSSFPFPLLPFPVLGQAALTDAWPEELTRVSAWELMSLEQEDVLVSLAYAHRNRDMLFRMLGCGVGSHSVQRLLRTSADPEAPACWPAFPVLLLESQLPTVTPRPTAVTLDVDTLCLLAAMLVTPRLLRESSLWKVAPLALRLLARHPDREDDLPKDFLLNLYHTTLRSRIQNCRDLTRKWKILYTILRHEPRPRADLQSRLRGNRRPSPEIRALAYVSVRGGNKNAVRIVKKLRKVAPCVGWIADSMSVPNSAHLVLPQRPW